MNDIVFEEVMHANPALQVFLCNWSRITLWTGSVSCTPAYLSSHRFLRLSKS